MNKERKIKCSQKVIEVMSRRLRCKYINQETRNFYEAIILKHVQIIADLTIK
jgi:hypothetical protein